MRKFLVMLILLFVPFQCLGYSMPDPNNKYIGYTYKGYAEKLKFSFLIVIEPDYDITSYSDGSSIMLWLERTNYNRQGYIVNNTVIDVITSPEKDRNYVFSYSCLLNGKYNKYIVAITKEVREGQRNKPKYAWRINLRDNRFEKISTEGISCMNPVDLDQL